MGGGARTHTVTLESSAAGLKTPSRLPRTIKITNPSPMETNQQSGKEGEQAQSNPAPEGLGFGGAPGSALEWEWFPNGSDLRGWLRGQPEITLFIIGSREGRRTLGGAFVPDADERERTYQVIRLAKAAAEEYLAAWVARNMPNASDDRQLPAASRPETKSDENSG